LNRNEPLIGLQTFVDCDAMCHRLNCKQPSIGLQSAIDWIATNGILNRDVPFGRGCGVGDRNEKAGCTTVDTAATGACL